jgi:Alw26I/Eco31I/Esp3I family type II restriction m6 adenine DNA methyltransferase
LIRHITASKSYRARSWEIELWDCDQEALVFARNAVVAKARSCGLEASVTTLGVDTFDHAPANFGKYDVVVTNPPWEVIKPDRRENSTLAPGKAQEYLKWLRDQSRRLAELYPVSGGGRKFSGWGVNLARCGTEAALRLTASTGICGIVSPASLWADQVSGSFREWICLEHFIHDLAFFPAEARLFDGVDQPSITMVVSPGKPKTLEFSATVYDRKRNPVRQFPMILDIEELQAHGFVIPLQFGLGQTQLQKKLHKLHSFQDLEGKSSAGLWAGRELDETGHKKYLANSGDYRFVKGRMIGRFRDLESPTQFVKRNGPNIPPSADHWRIAWRDVSRPTQKRRIQATLIPPGWVSGNSLSVAYFRKDDRARLKALLAVMNSLVFEFQVRGFLSTAHVSLGAVRRARIPDLSDRRLIRRLAQLVNRCTKHASAEVELEIAIAGLYGLCRAEFAELLTHFEKLDRKEVHELLSPSKWVSLPNDTNR